MHPFASYLLPMCPCVESQKSIMTEPRHKSLHGVCCSLRLEEY